jgi:hypothetical protein
MQRNARMASIYSGYSAPGLEKVSQHVYDPSELSKHRAKAPDVKESFECGREEAEDMPNIWLPEGVLPGFKEACLDFFWVCWHTYSNICLTELNLFWRIDLLRTRAEDSQGSGPWIQPRGRLFFAIPHSARQSIALAALPKVFFVHPFWAIFRTH